MKAVKETAAALAATLVITGCANSYGAVLPLGSGAYEVTSTGKVKADALKGAQLEAEKTCKKATGKKQFYAIERESEFTGVTIDRGEGGTTRSVIAGALETVAKMQNDSNYEARITFRCAAAPAPQAVASVPPSSADRPADAAAAAAPVQAAAAAPAPAREQSRSRTIEDIYAKATAN